MCNTNLFEDLDAFSIYAIQEKAKKLACHPCFSISDVDDIEVELVLRLRQQICKHDSARGSLKTFVSRVLDNRIRLMIDERKTRHFNYQSVGIGCALRGFSDEPDSDYVAAYDDSPLEASQVLLDFSDCVLLRVELQRVFQALPPHLVKLCRHLATSSSMAEASRAMGISRDTVYEWRRQLQFVFRRFGLDPSHNG